MRAAFPIDMRRAVSISLLVTALFGGTASCSYAQSGPAGAVGATAVCPGVLAGERAQRIADRVADRFAKQQSQWNSASALTYFRSQLATGLRAELASSGRTTNDPVIRDLSGTVVSACFPGLGAVMAGLTQGSDYERFTAAQRQRREEEAARRQAEAEASRQRADAERQRQAELRQERDAEVKRQQAEQQAAAESLRAQREAAATAQNAAERGRLAHERTAPAEPVRPSPPPQMARAGSAAAAQTDAGTSSCPAFLRTSRASRIADSTADRFEAQRSQFDTWAQLTFFRDQLSSGLQSELTSYADADAIRTLSATTVTACFPRLGAVMGGAALDCVFRSIVIMDSVRT